MFTFCSSLLAVLLLKQVVYGAPDDSQDIAKKLQDDLTFSSRQLQRGVTSILGPATDIASDIPKGVMTIGSEILGSFQKIHDANVNLGKTLMKDGTGAFGEGLKLTSTVVSSPGRLLGSGLEALRGVGKTGVESGIELGQAGSGSVVAGITGGTKLVHELLNSTTSRLQKANLGAIILELAARKRVSDLGEEASSVVRDTGTKGAKVLEAGGEATSSAAEMLIALHQKAVETGDSKLLDLFNSFASKTNN